jgi:hypothetical protein
MPFEIKNEDNISAKAGTSYAIAALSCVFSYAAIEAFVNMGIFQHLKKAEELNHKNLRGECEISEFDKKLSIENPTKESIEGIISGKTTSEKLKFLCHLSGLKRIHDADPKLWQEFMGLLKEFRDYVIHPKPFPKESGGKIGGLLIRNKLGSYNSIASRVIRYFYLNLPDLVPEWIENNQYLKLNGVTIL